VVVNSNLPNNAGQNSWLQNTLTAANTNSSIDFVFVFCHHPGRTEAWDDNSAFVQNSVIPWMSSCTKSAFLAYGHTHDYERGAEITANDHDFTLINSSGGGADDLALWSYCNPGGSYTCNNWPEVHRTFDHYNFQIVEIDAVEKIETVTCYSMNYDASSKPYILDRFHLHLDQPAPQTPTCQAYGLNTAAPYLQACAFSSPAGDSIMSSQFQCTLTEKDYSSPVVDVVRHWEDFYMDPTKTRSINLNAGIDLSKLDLAAYPQLNGKQFWYRMRYRDSNLKWSAWSDQTTAVVASVPGTLKLELMLGANPALDVAPFSFKVDKQDKFTVDIFNINGQLVKRLHDGILPAGVRQFRWDGTDLNGRRSSSAYYFIRVARGKDVLSKKIAFFNYK
jgi:hypothetical protein